MVRKIMCCVICGIMLVSCLATTALAATHSVYNNGTISSTYLTYFKDILAGLPFNTNYIAFRSGQNEYAMIVGDLDINDGVITLNGTGKSYIYTNQYSDVNNQYRYFVDEINNFSIDTANYIVYTDLGEHPQLVERGAKYEMLNTLLLCILIVGFVVARIFYRR